MADIAVELPPRAWYSLDIHYRLHKGMVAKRHFWNPHGAEEMSPCRGIRLLETPIRVGTEDAGL